MTQDEIRKLLGGYATDALTDHERQSLFEAALEDQELFNALQNEDALKELLADPALRDDVRRALQTSTRDTHRTGFSWRRWGLGVAVPALVAVIVIAFMNHAKAPQPAQEARLSEPPAAPAPMASTLEPAPKVAAAPVAKKLPPTVQPSMPVKASTPIKPAGRAIASPVPSPTTTDFLAAVQRPIPDAVRQQFSAGLAQNGPFYRGPLVRYSLVRSGDAGDLVRVEVSTQTAGYLALYRLDAAGNWTRVYPENEPAQMILPDAPMQIPTTAIRITDAGSRLRLVLSPAAPTQVTKQLSEPAAGLIGGAANGVVRPAIAQQLRAPSPLPKPMVVDIPLGPN
jgi:hypothetical protein